MCISMDSTNINTVWWILLHTLSSIFSVNSEDSRLVDSPMDEARAIGTHIATVHVVHIEL